MVPLLVVVVVVVAVVVVITLAFSCHCPSRRTILSLVFGGAGRANCANSIYIICVCVYLVLVRSVSLGCRILTRIENVLQLAQLPPSLSAYIHNVALHGRRRRQRFTHTSRTRTPATTAHTRSGKAGFSSLPPPPARAGVVRRRWRRRRRRSALAKVKPFTDTDPLRRVPQKIYNQHSTHVMYRFSRSTCVCVRHTH